jgi:hypothetical protein
VRRWAIVPGPERHARDSDFGDPHRKSEPPDPASGRKRSLVGIRARR